MLKCRYFSLVLVLIFASGVMVAADPQLEKLAVPPSEVPAAVNALLDPNGFKVAADGKTLGEFWICKEVPAAASADTSLGVNFGTIPVSAFLGVAKITSWSDYKGQVIPAGVYTLRYGLLPADGNHMGVSPQHDYLLIAPIAADGNPGAKPAKEELYKLSAKASGTNHPAVLSLFPVFDDVTEPKLMQNDTGQWMVALPVGAAKIGIVVVGHGEGS